VTDAIRIEAVDAQARGLRARRPGEGFAPLAVLRRLDGLLLLAVLGSLAYGLWAIAGITKHDPGGSALSRQGAYATAGLVAMVAALLIDPAVYHRFAGLI
jgi:hypothetical protein